jgi:hypothetical protein
MNAQPNICSKGRHDRRPDEAYKKVHPFLEIVNLKVIFKIKYKKHNQRFVFADLVSAKDVIFHFFIFFIYIFWLIAAFGSSDQGF